MCRNYDAGECTKEGCTNRITCQDFMDDKCGNHSINGWNNVGYYDRDEETMKTTIRKANSSWTIQYYFPYSGVMEASFYTFEEAIQEANDIEKQKAFI